jgi:hypothetical protein
VALIVRAVIVGMGPKNTKHSKQSKRNAVCANANSNPLQYPKLDQNPVFSTIANVQSIVCAHCAITARFPGVPKELLTAILLDMRVSATRVRSTHTLTATSVLPDADKLCIFGEVAGIALFFHFAFFFFVLHFLLSCLFSYSFVIRSHC